MISSGTDERKKELTYILRRHSVADGEYAEPFINDILAWHVRKTIVLRGRIKELEKALLWFCRRVYRGSIRSKLTDAVFRSILDTRESWKDYWSAEADKIAEGRREFGYGEDDWDWRSGVGMPDEGE